MALCGRDSKDRCMSVHWPIADPLSRCRAVLFLPIIEVPPRESKGARTTSSTPNCRNKLFKAGLLPKRAPDSSVAYEPRVGPLRIKGVDLKVWGETLKIHREGLEVDPGDREAINIGTWFPRPA